VLGSVTLSQTARTLAKYHVRNVDVELSAELTFRLLETRHVLPRSHWSRVWPASIALSRWLLAERYLPATSTELGCGLGLVSMTLAHLGLTAEATDRVPDALSFAAENAARNQLSGFTTRHLDWGAPSGLASDLILGADIVYEPEAPERLFRLLDTARFLVPGGRLVISGPRARAQLFGQLMRALSREGYVHQEDRAIVAWEGREEVIDVHVFQRP